MYVRICAGRIGGQGRREAKGLGSLGQSPRGSTEPALGFREGEGPAGSGGLLVCFTVPDRLSVLYLRLGPATARHLESVLCPSDERSRP